MRTLFRGICIPCATSIFVVTYMSITLSLYADRSGIDLSFRIDLLRGTLCLKQIGTM